MAICIMIHEMKILRDKMSEIGMTQEFLAKKIGVTGVHLSKVLNGIA